MATINSAGQTVGGVSTVAVTIANGQDTSGSASLDGADLVGIKMPAAWTTAGLAFQASIDGTNFYKVVKATDSSEVTITSTGVDMYITGASGAPILKAVPYLKVVSGTNAAKVAQGADRVITLVYRVGVG